MKGQLEIRRMSRAQLWRRAWQHFYEVEPYTIGGRTLQERQLQWRQLRMLLLELELRGDQLSLGNLDAEQVSADS